MKKNQKNASDGQEELNTPATRKSVAKVSASPDKRSSVGTATGKKPANGNATQAPADAKKIASKQPAPVKPKPKAFATAASITEAGPNVAGGHKGQIQAPPAATKIALPNSGSNGAKPKARPVVTTVAKASNQQQAVAAGNAALTSDSTGIDAKKPPRPTQAVGSKKNIPDDIESTIAEKNLAALDAATAKKHQENGDAPRQNPSLQINGDPVEKQLANPPAGRTPAQNSPLRVRAHTEEPRSTQNIDNSVAADGTNKDAPQSIPKNDRIARTSSAPGEARAAYNPPLQRENSAGPKVPSAIEFDPLKSPVELLGLSIEDTAGRNSPLDTQSISSTNATGFQNMDVGLGPGDNLSVANPPTHQQPFEASLAAMPLDMGLAPSNGTMNFTQAVAPYQQVDSMVPLTSHTGPFLANGMADQRNGGLASNLSVLQQPYLQVPSDQQSIHSMPLPDVSQQPLILFHVPPAEAAPHQHHHYRGMSAHDLSSSETLLGMNTIGSMSSLEDLQRAAAPHHVRARSSNTLPNMTSSWSQAQNAQWLAAYQPQPQQQQQPVSMLVGSYSGSYDTPPTNNLQQQQEQQQPASGMSSSDPFDDLVARRPVSAMSNSN